METAVIKVHGNLDRLGTQRVNQSSRQATAITNTALITWWQGSIGKQGGLYSLKTRNLENCGKWRPSNSIDQGVKQSKGLRSPILFLPLGVKVSWKTRPSAYLENQEAGNPRHLGIK